MNVIFAAVMLGACAVFLFTDPEGFLPAMLAGGEKAAHVCLALLASYCVWLGFFRVLEATGLAKKLSAALYPAARRLFRSGDARALSLACQNIAANMLGLPGAPTPLGIAATKKFLAAKNGYAAEMLFVLNATSLQLLPTTAIALRAAAGSASPAAVLLPTLLASACSTLAGVALLALFSRPRPCGRRARSRTKEQPA